MGYDCTYEGNFELNRPLDDDTYKLLKGLATTRRVKRDPKKLEELGYGAAESFGVEGELFINAEGFMGQDGGNPSILNYNKPPADQPSLWLQWIPTEDRKYIIWDQGEKFTTGVEWLQYLIDKILSPRDFVLNGTVNVQGEQKNNQWHIRVHTNKVFVNSGFSEYAPVPKRDNLY